MYFNSFQYLLDRQHNINLSGTSLEAQRLGLHLPVQGFRLITGQEARIQKTKTLNGGNITTNSIKDFKKDPHQIKVFLKKRKKTHSMNNLK